MKFNPLKGLADVSPEGDSPVFDGSNMKEARIKRSCFCRPISNELHGLSPRVNYTDRATAASRRSDCQLLRIKGAMWSA
jgi:hypothetical protein